MVHRCARKVSYVMENLLLDNMLDADEKKRSTRTELGIMLRKSRAIRDKIGYKWAFSFHHSKIFTSLDTRAVSV